MHFRYELDMMLEESRMNMKKLIILFICLLCFTTGCEDKNVIEKTNAGYTHISMDVAKEYMKEQDTIVVDVRTEEEYETGHIKGAINIPLHAIDGTVVGKLKDYNQKILVYCESGIRSIQASAKLASLGYKNVYEMGGIQDYDGELSQS